MGKTGFFSQGWTSLGARPGMSFEQRIAANFISWAGLVVGVLGFLFAGLNLVQRNFHLIGFNLVGSAAGIMGLLAVARGQLSWAIGLLCGICFVDYFLQAFFLRNGNEILLLVFLTITMYLTESPARRRLVALGTGVAYLVIEAGHLDNFSHPEVTKARFLVNVAVGLVSLYVYHEMIHTVTSQYRQTVEAKNRKLDAQSRLLQAEQGKLREANSAKERLFSILSHDLCAPVGNLKEALAYLEDGRLSQEQFRTMQKGFREEVDHVFNSLQGLLEWSAQQMEGIAPRFGVVDLGGVCGEAVGLLKPIAEKKAIALENRIAPGILVRADRDQVRAVFRNLFSNALKFTPSGGSVQAEVEAGAEAEGEVWRVTVRDTGIGISEERARRLFEDVHLESTPGLAQEKGLGLGLAICRDFVRAHHGAIWVETVPGRGTAIHFTLSRAELA